MGQLDIGERSSAAREHRSSKALTDVIVALALGMFVYFGGLVVPGALGLVDFDKSVSTDLVTSFLLTIAVLLFAWRRSSNLRTMIAARDAAERQAYELAVKDDTTSLFNRRFLFERLKSLLSDETEVVLLLIDLDHFKNVNDIYGHAAGDALLREAALRIENVSPDGACCARLGGDEFAVLLHDKHAGQLDATNLAERLLETMKEPIRLENTIALTGASIGLSMADPQDRRPETLLRRSDIAMYQAKAQGRGCCVWFDEEMELELNRRTRLEVEMRESLAQGRFVPYFQPLIDLNSGEIKGFEVLARWDHPERGIVEPIEFIPIAEATGLISELSLSVMRDALLMARDWPHHLTIAVNVSPVQFKDPLLDQRVMKVLVETGFPANRLELELTENALLDDSERARVTVESLKNQGVRISLDDFGTGYASLSQLRSLPFDRIKIDKSFVASLLEDPQSNAIVHAIATLGKSLDLPITAEGVETNEIHERLKELGCDDAQGWLFGKAVPGKEASAMFGVLGSSMERSELAPAKLPEIDPFSERRDHSRRAKGA